MTRGAAYPAPWEPVELTADWLAVVDGTEPRWVRWVLYGLRDALGYSTQDGWRLSDYAVVVSGTGRRGLVVNGLALRPLQRAAVALWAWRKWARLWRAPGR